MSVVARGPVFISYRHSDGYEIAAELAWALRAAGVPVWHDASDLPPGDTRQRLQEALESGLSGAVLLVTADIGLSNVVRDIELPMLLRLAQDSSFTLSVASTLQTPAAGVDYQKADDVLGQPPGTLAVMLQQLALTAEQRAEIAQGLCRRRLEQLRPDIAEAGSVLRLDIQTRAQPYAVRADVDLVVRLRPSGDGQRRPSLAGLHDLRRVLAQLPQLVAVAGARSVEVSGGAHLSVACALGAAMPTTLLGRVEVVAVDGAHWAINATAATSDQDADRLIGAVVEPTSERDEGPVLVYVDLVPERSDAAFDDFIRSSPGLFAGWLHLRPRQEGLLQPASADRVIAELNQAVRRFAATHATSDVHLLLRCPYPVALLLGRCLNTLTVTLYEWENAPKPGEKKPWPRFLPNLVVRSGAGGSPVQVIAPPDL